MELTLEGRNGENNLSVELGILIGLSSILFFSNKTYGGPHHPDTDKRITRYLEKLKPSNDHSIWGIAALCLRLWDTQFNLNFNWPLQVNDFKELYYSVLQQI